MKRIILFLATNIAVVATLSIVAAIACHFCGLTAEEYAQLQAGFLPLLIFAFVIGMTGALISLLLSKTIVRRIMRCRTIDGSEGPAERWLVATIEDLAQRAHIRTPEIAIYKGDANAFATGAFKNSALVAVSTGILEQMTRDELRAVLGHEISHVANGDMVTLSLTQGVINTFVIFFAHILAQLVQNAMNGNNRNRSQRNNGGGNYFLYYMIYHFFQMILGIFGSIILFWYSRKREYAADAGSAQLLGSPLLMIAALRRLGNLKPGVLPNSLKAFGITGGKTSLFASHPSLEDRINALQNMTLPYAS